MATTALCTKRRFRDRIAAELVLAAITRKDSTRRREKRAYRCPGCLGWHLTSRPARRP